MLGDEGGEGRPTMPNTSNYTKESGYPMKRTASHHSGDYGWAVKQASVIDILAHAALHAYHAMYNVHTCETTCNRWRESDVVP